MNNAFPIEKRKPQAWTFVEMLVAISLSAIFLGAAALVLQAITVNSKRLTSLIEVTIGESKKLNFYGQSGDSLRVYSAPNYGRLLFAKDLRTTLLDDVDRSSAVFCLPRSIDNSIRPEFLRYLPGDDGSTLSHPQLDSPEAFRRFLADVEPTSAAIFDTSIRNVPDPNKPNTTIFLLAPESSPSFIRVHAVYEIDFVTPTNIAGDYISVRRYKNGTLTNYYDIFHHSGDGPSLLPSFVAFESESRLATTEGESIDRFKIAPESPFYFLWLPDPSINPQRNPAWGTTYPSDTARNAYGHLSENTSMLTVIPMFPSI